VAERYGSGRLVGGAGPAVPDEDDRRLQVDDQLAAIIAEGVPTGLTDWSNDRLREARAADEAAEAAVSYARRVLQGRLDIVRADLERRRDAGDESVEHMLAGLPALLAGDHIATDPARARPTSVAIPERAEALVARIDADLGETTLATLPDREDTEVAELLAHLERHEGELSRARRVLFDRIDAIRDELAARYKDGRARVADLLR
jgi:hypothetical protein